MAGHSHWANIKHKKERSAKKRSVAFTRAAKQIMTAIREGGPNPENNSSLRAAIEYALSVNMPKDNINRIIQKASGQLESEDLKEGLYEAYGPDQIPMLIEVLTDNLNRTVNDLRLLLSQVGGRLADKGAVAWQFKETGLIKFLPEKNGSNIDQDECMLEVLDVGDIDDVVVIDGQCNVLVDKKNISTVAKKIEELGYKIVFAGRYFWATNSKNVSKEVFDKYNELVDKLEELNEIQNIWARVETTN